VISLWEAWNHRDPLESGEEHDTGIPEAWTGFVARREALEAHAGKWARTLATRRDLAAELVDFTDNVLK